MLGMRNTGRRAGSPMIVAQGEWRSRAAPDGVVMGRPRIVVDAIEQTPVAESVAAALATCEFQRSDRLICISAPTEEAWY